MALLQRGRCRLTELLGNMSQAEFSRRMGVAESTISRWISKERDMSYENAVLGARILDCHAEDFYEWVEIPRKKRQ